MSAGMEDFQSIDFRTPEDYQHWIDNNPHLSPAEQRRAEADLKEWQSALGQDHVERLNTHSAAITKEFGGLAEAIDRDCREGVQIPQDLKTGRITSKEATKRLAELARNRASYVKILDAITGSIERWESSADAEPSEHLREMQERFRTGSPRHGVHSVTVKTLRGER